MNTLAPLPIVAALVLALLPPAAADPYGLDCADPATYDPARDDVQCLTIVGPGGLAAKSVGGLGIGICTGAPGAPFPCGPGPATASGFGAAIFDPGPWPVGAKTVGVWVQWVAGVCGIPVTGDGCGFDILLCNDVDYDGICADAAFSPDQLFRSQSNEAILGAICADADKDLKDCGDPLDAQIGACLTPALPPNPDWSFAQVVVFVGTWVDAWPGAVGPPLNVGGGFALGSFEAWLAMDDGCAACADGLDNDGTEGTDFPTDGGCTSYFDPAE